MISLVSVAILAQVAVARLSCGCEGGPLAPPTSTRSQYGQAILLDWLRGVAALVLPLLPEKHPT